MDTLKQGKYEFGLPPLNGNMQPIETGVIGSILLDFYKDPFKKPACLDRIPYLLPEDFTTETARLVFQYFLDDTKSGEGIDLGDNKRYTPEIMQYMQECLRMTPTSENIEAYAQALRENTKDLTLYAEARAFQDAIVEKRDLEKALADFKAAADKAISSTITEREKNSYKSKSNASFMVQFTDKIDEAVSTPAISTGFPELNEALDGGLYEGLYTLGGITSLGKTSLILQIADQIAIQGKDVLFIALEMSRYELIAKSISRLTYQFCNAEKPHIPYEHAKTARGVLSGDKYDSYTDKGRELILKAEMTYSKYADHIYMVEGIGDIGVKEIRQLVSRHKALTGKAPVVIVDYLQILAPYNVKYTDKQNTDKNVLELKRISRDYKTPVICLSSLNRMNYQKEISLEAFKESGAIEYSSDVLLGLQLTAEKGDSTITEAEMEKNTRDVEIKILKNRNGRTGAKVNFSYRTLFSCFE